MANPESNTPDDDSTRDLEKGDMFQEEEGAEFRHETHPHTPTTSASRQENGQTDQENGADIPKPEANLTDWNGPDDPDNPQNWSMTWRIYHAAIPALFGFAVTFGTSVYTPALADIMHDFQISRTVAILGLSIYTLGIGFGPTLTAPLSEGHGRKIVYLVSSPIFMLFTLGSGFSKNFALLCVCRFIAGFTGSPALAVGAGSNADLFPPQQRAVSTSIIMMAPFAGPSLGPIVGGFVAQYKGWRWTQWCLLFITLVIFVAALPMQETYKPIILQRRAKKLGLSVKPAPGGVDIKRTFALKLARPMHMLFTEPAVFFFSLYTSFAFGVLFLFFAAFPYIFALPPYSFSTSQAGLTFIAIGIGVLLGGITCIVVDRYLYQKKHHEAMAAGRPYADPEYRLYAAMIGSWGILIGLFWFGWCAGKGVHWAPTLLGAIPFAWGNLCLFTSSALYLVDVYGPLNGASAMAANGVSRYTLGAVFPLFTIQMYKALGVSWATSLLGFLSLAMIPIPYLFFKYGPSIRARSKYPVAT
ncbi:major facilitator superfamily domain-containing protein [Pyrenochaeta sp. MPI-SDFR-AT-0127]|nr:major facilitator superfamily domain-containing protein [Pyrenochaeta sp. MPI-SDFR-AT-0127]